MKYTGNEIITEIVPLPDKYGFYAVERHKTTFDYPIHCHDAYEINFLIGCKGARRIIGDSVEELSDLDLVFIGPGIEHGWQSHKCKSPSIHEYTIQLGTNFYIKEYLLSNKLGSVLHLLNISSKGVAFGTETILKAFHHIERVVNAPDSLEGLFAINILVKELSRSKDYRTLSSSTFSNTYTSNGSRRITKVQKYIAEHVMEKIRLVELANIAGMTESSFSRFFKLHTGTSVSDYIISLRLGNAIRKLVDTKMSVSEICYECGFNNVSHFSRCFRNKKGCSPSEFRDMYKSKMS